jgi:hypothetical protein
LGRILRNTKEIAMTHSGQPLSFKLELRNVHDYNKMRIMKIQEGLQREL